MKQLTFASLSYDLKKKQTRRERFLLEMEQVVPWDALLAVVEPYVAGSLFSAVVQSVGSGG